MNQHFFLWYVTRGLQSVLALSLDLLYFVMHRFHIVGLLQTLLSPWKRDVALHDWRGLRPLKSLSTFFENFISRFLGMLVRLVVIIAGITLATLTLVGVVSLSLLYVFALPSLVLGVILFMVNPLLGGWLLLFGIFGGVCVFIGFLLRKQDDAPTSAIEVLRRKRWFERLLLRLGLEKKSLDASLFNDTTRFLAFLATQGIEQNTFEKAVTLEREQAKRRDQKRRFWTRENIGKTLPIGKGWCYAYTPHLDRYSLDLSSYDPTEYAHAELIGRQEELKVATIVLERPTQNSILLVGDPGIGKKTLAHHLARMIRENELLHTPLAEARVLLFDLGRAVSDATNQSSDKDGFIRRLFSEAYAAGNVILVIENIDVFLGGDVTRQNLAPVLSEFLALPGFRVIATATTGRYHAIAKTDEQALKSFETIYLREPDEEETLRIVARYFEQVERKRIVFTLPALISIVSQASRYNWEVPFPERAIDLAQEVLSYWQGVSDTLITPATVDAFVSLRTGVPTGSIGGDEKEKLLHLEERLHERVIGQNEAVKQVAEAMRKARAGFGNKKRPLGSFIFLGPTGVGKTETVKALAESYFGSEDQMIRLDMSEYQGADSIARLIGSEEMGVPGQLTNAIKEHPFSILLLDEVEKAYPQALDLFLQILDEGYVTDGFGVKVSFRNTIIVATSNAGAALIKSELAAGKTMADIRQEVIDYVVEHNIYRMEFLNRFDGMIFFEPLKQEELVAVTMLKLESFAERLKKDKNVAITFASGVAEKIVEHGYEPEFGARSINRYIENTIEDAVVKQIIAGEVVSGGALHVALDDLS